MPESERRCLALRISQGQVRADMKGLQSIAHDGDSLHLPNVVNAHDVCPCEDACCNRRRSSFHAITNGQVENRTYERFTRYTHENRVSARRQYVQLTDQPDIV